MPRQPYVQFLPIADDLDMGAWVETHPHTVALTLDNKRYAAFRHDGEFHAFLREYGRSPRDAMVPGSVARLDAKVAELEQLFELLDVKFKVVLGEDLPRPPVRDPYFAVSVLIGAILLVTALITLTYVFLLEAYRSTP